VTSHEANAQGAIALLPSFLTLAHDPWWEVQAQLMLLTAQLLGYLANAPDTPENASAAEHLLGIANHLFEARASSMFVLQVGLCSLVRSLRAFPALLPGYLSALLRQPCVLRQRLLQSIMRADEAAPPPSRRLPYVMATSCRLYEEVCVCDIWPALKVAGALAEHAKEAQLEHFEPEHLEVLLACLPPPEMDLGEEWLTVFERVKAYVFVALIDPVLHLGAREVVRRFWLCRPQVTALKAIEASRKTLLQTLRINYSDTGHTRVQEAELLELLREMRDAGGAILGMLQGVVDQFREAHNVEFQRSRLDTLFE